MYYIDCICKMEALNYCVITEIDKKLKLPEMELRLQGGLWVQLTAKWVMYFFLHTLKILLNVLTPHLLNKLSHSPINKIFNNVRCTINEFWGLFTHTGLNLIQCWYLHMCKGAHYTVIFDLLIDAEKKLMKLLHVNFHLENIRFVFKYQQAENFVRFWNCKCLPVTHLQICSGTVKRNSS